MTSPAATVTHAAAAAPDASQTETSPKKLRIVFMGTPDFAVASLHQLIEDGQQVVAVVTATDKPAGRGRELRSSPVKNAALSLGIPVLQPAKLNDSEFLEKLHSLQPDLQVVVAFRMLPETVWKLPRIGTVNLHASLLPQYRGAAPINWAIINGEKYTGVTTFFINQEIDTGEILFQEKTRIDDDDTAGTLHDQLKESGSRLLVKTVQKITLGDYARKPQAYIANDEMLKSAPKINKADCRINWSAGIHEISNFIRGLSPYPAAWSELTGEKGNFTLKIYRAEAFGEKHVLPFGTILSDDKTFLKVAANGGFIAIKELQLPGKNKLAIHEFLKGFQQASKFHFV
jgi:methionyl-tRNA formyltransferase